MDQKGHRLDQKGLRMCEKKQKMEFLYLKYLLFSGTFLSGIGGTPSPPLWKIVLPKNPQRKVGVPPPPLNKKNPLSSGGVFHVIFCFTSCGLLSWNTLLHFIFHLVSPAMQVSFVAVLSFPTRICCFQREPCAHIPTRFRRQVETCLTYQARNQMWTLSIAALV